MRSCVDDDKSYNSTSPPPKYTIRTPRTFIHSRTRHLGSRGVINLEMKLCNSFFLALASVSDAKKGGKKNKENYHHVIVSGNDERAFGTEYCLAEQNEDGILTMTTTIGLNEVASCHRQLGCRDGYTLARKIVSIDGLQDCFGCQDDDGWQATGPQPESGWLCHNNYDHNSFKFKYRMRLPNRYF